MRRDKRTEISEKMKTRRSTESFQQARRYLVEGVNSPVRSFKAVGGEPLLMRSGRRSKLIDQDGNVYTDYCLSWGALIAGHAHRNVILAAKKYAERGLSFGTTTRAEIDLAEFIVDHVPSIDRVRFVNSGTEATMSAVRLARGFTGRPMVVKFDGCYHGHVDALLATAGSGVAHLPESSSSGIPAGHIENTLSLPYNDPGRLEEALERHHEKIACVILEPVAGNMGVIPAEPVFLKRLRELTQRHGIVLIFDEIMTGFRTSPGCVQSECGVIPDMTCLGKIIGGGFPVGAYGGRADIMNCLAPAGPVYQAGTFSGNPIVMRAGLATLRLLDGDFYRSLNAKAGRFAEEMNAFFAVNPDVQASLSAYHSMLSLRFRREPVRNYDEARQASGGERYARLFRFLLGKGVYWPPADLEAFFISGMHSKKELAGLAGYLKEFLGEETDG